MRSQLRRCFPFVALLVACSAFAAEPAPPAARPSPKPERYAKAIAAFSAQEPEKHGIVFIGSSATTRWKSLPEDFPKLPVLNRAFGGSRINDLIFHFDTVVLRHEPKLVVIDIGGNDLNAGRSVEEAFADYIRLIDLVHAQLPKSRVVINSLGISIKRVTQIPQILELNGQLAAWTHAHEWARYVDRTVYQLGADGEPKREHYIDDLLHPSRGGYEEWIKVLGPVLREEWAKVAPSSLATEPAPSSGEEHLRRWLKRFPDADFDQNGILTAEEAWRYQGEGPQRARARRVEKQRAAAEAEAAGRAVSPEPRLAPDFADVRYGPHERNGFDLWLAKSPRPTPFVIFVHGGAWKIGDKRDVHDATVRACLDAGISVAAVNYRFTTTAPLPAPYLDAARALQFLRANATRWNLDPKRVAAYGASAGAVTSLWLAFHPDLADPNSDDPVARESTRLTCAGSLNGQPTIDPFVIREWIGESAFQHTTFLAAFGVKSHADLSDPQLQPVIAEMSPLTHLTRDDVPVFQSYTEPDAPLPPNAKRGQGIHHPIFGHKLKEAMGRVALECSYLHVADIPGDPELVMVEFFNRQFGRP